MAENIQTVFTERFQGWLGFPLREIQLAENAFWVLKTKTPQFHTTVGIEQASPYRLATSRSVLYVCGWLF